MQSELEIDKWEYEPRDVDQSTEIKRVDQDRTL